VGTHIACKGVKENPILIILKVFIDLMLPKYTASACDIDEGKEMGPSVTVHC
jgi:hypothetical protein